MFGLLKKKKDHHLIILYVLVGTSIFLSIAVFLQLIYVKNQLLHRVTKLQYQQELYLQKNENIDELDWKKIQENMEILNDKFNALAQ